MGEILKDITYERPDVGYEEADTKRPICGCCRTHYVVSAEQVQALEQKYLEKR